MPYIEILAPVIGQAAQPTRRQAAVQAITDGVVQGFGVEPATVTVYFVPLGLGDYGHEGQLGQAGDDGPRVFAKVHAYRRSPAHRRAAAQAITPALAQCFDTASHNVAVYFLDREQDEVAHDGHLACD